MISTSGSCEMVPIPMNDIHAVILEDSLGIEINSTSSSG